MLRGDLQSLHVGPHLLHVHADLSGTGECEKAGPSAMGNIEVQSAVFDVRLAPFRGLYLDLPDVLPLDVHSKVEAQANSQYRAA